MTTSFLWIVWAVVVTVAAALRGRFYAAFVVVFYGVGSLCLAGLLPVVPAPVAYALLGLHGLAGVHFVVLARPRLRPLWYRVAVSLPGLWLLSAVILAWPWAIAGVVFDKAPGWWLPFALSIGGLVQSLRNPWRVTPLPLDRTGAGELARHRIDRDPPDRRPLRVAQITDPHVGPFMSVERLRRIVERVVAAEPDLVLITGDLLTMESHEAEARVAWAYEPLRALPGRVFGCLGNHDHEARDTVRHVFDHIGGTLLVDQATVVDTPIGPVEIVGADWRFRDRRRHLEELFEALGPRGAVPRLFLLHDPGGFPHLRDNAADLTLSGHTHGGQVGLISLGFAATALTPFESMPDHGLWAMGHNRLYVHRGTGHYGFPIRLGVPGEEGILELWFDCVDD